MSTQEDEVKLKFPYINPTGKGGFQDHPELRSPGGWSPETTFSYCYRMFMAMNEDDFKTWMDKHPKRTVVQSAAWNAVKKLSVDLKYLQEVTNRVEGTPRQTIDQTVKNPDVANSIDKFGDMLKSILNSKNDLPIIEAPIVYAKPLLSQPKLETKLPPPIVSALPEPIRIGNPNQPGQFRGTPDPTKIINPVTTLNGT